MYAGVSLDQAPPEDIPFRFFLSAPIFGVIVGLLIAFNGKSLFSSSWDLEVVALTHAITLGWLASIMIGAFYQMVPVLVGGTVPYIFFSRVVHAVFTIGVLLIIGGLYFFTTAALHGGTFLLLLAFIFFIVQLGIALFRVKPDRPTVVAMMISLISLAITVIIGILFAGNYAGWWSVSMERTQIIGIHLTFGLFGWVTTLIMGVGFHIIPMFYLTPVFPVAKAKKVLQLMTLSLALVPLCLFFGFNTFWLILAAIPGFSAMILFVKTTRHMFNQRKRKVMDTTIRCWQLGLISLPLSLVFLLLYQIWPISAFAFIFAFFFLIGFALAITSGMLYKIVPFLVWFHRFSMLIGKVPVPLLKDISPDKNARLQWKFLTIAMITLLLAVILGFDLATRLGGLLLAASSLHLFINLVKMVRIKTPEVPLQAPEG
ncbi:MAG: hypothetical protein IME96_11190 [Proteobacteria bacterium]|nr:hypothetical protein [Pseudomonadota bacterium]